jgi:AcrR family transcriptional regulator
VPKVSQAHLDARREQILDAATVCFARKGIRETTMQELCAEAGLSAGAIYRYFGGKQEILYAVFARHRADARGLGGDFEGSDDPLAVFRGLLGGMFELVERPELHDSHRLSLMVFGEAMRDPKVATSYSQLHRETAARMAGLFDALQAVGRVPAHIDVEYLVWHFVVLYQGFRVQKMLDPTLDTERFKAVALSIFDAVMERPPDPSG